MLVLRHQKLEYKFLIVFLHYMHSIQTKMQEFHKPKLNHLCMDKLLHNLKLVL